MPLPRILFYLPGERLDEIYRNSQKCDPGFTSRVSYLLLAKVALNLSYVILFSQGVTCLMWFINNSDYEILFFQK